MKSFFYIAGISLIAAACSTTRHFSSTMEDDIYYVPGQKALVVQEVEELTGKAPESHPEARAYPDESSAYPESNTPPASLKRTPVVNARTGKPDQVNMQELSQQAQQILAGEDDVNNVLYENTGYWIGGYKGSESDLPEIQRIINLYPEGFAYFNANGQDIAINLSFDPDWNVFTDNDRYWWFPSSSNIDLYSSLLFGTYPKYIWTVIWDNPGFDSWAFDASFNRGFNLGLSAGWGGPGWSFGLGWNNSWYRPWFNPYGGWYNPWYDPWWGGYYPGWHYPHWHYPHWNHPLPDWRPPYRPGTSLRPNNGGGVTGIRPGNIHRPGNGSIVRPGSSTSGGSYRPGTMVRPHTGATRPNSGVNRPNSGVSRPSTGTMTRPGSGTVTSPTRPNSGLSRPGMVRPATPSTNRPQYTRPSTTNRPQYTRPSTPRSSSGSTVRNPSRSQSNYRPTYNNNSSSRYNPGVNRPASVPGNRGSYSPSRSGNVSRPSTPVHRPTRR